MLKQKQIIGSCSLISGLKAKLIYQKRIKNLK